jgi:hypothetical protein
MAEEQGAEERPEWLPEQFQSPEALAESYAQLRPEMDRMRSQFDQERQQFQLLLEQQQEQFQALVAEQQRQPPPPPDNNLGMANPLVEAFGRGYEEGDPARMIQAAAQYTQQPLIEAVGRLMDEKLQALNPALQQQQAFQREANLRMAEANYAARIGPEEYRELMPSISNILSQNTNWLPENGTVEGYEIAIDNAAKLAQHDSLVNRMKALEAERAEKLAAQTLSGAGRGSVYSEDEAEAMRNRIRNADNSSYAQLRANSGG